MSSSDTVLAGALHSFRTRTLSTRDVLAATAYGTAREPAGLAEIDRLEGYLEGYLEALKLAPPELATRCAPEARALLQDLAAILVTAS